MDVQAVKFPKQFSADLPLPKDMQIRIGGCKGFSKLEMVRGKETVDLNVWGWKAGKDQACPTIPDRWTPLSISVPAEFMFNGTLKIVVNSQPYGTVTVQ
ncbi:hypothetical protein E7T06_00955 [Deinococcus sp. Arct2-2]|uniref:hypothetical protein n=1 Tax=Deinococcus sp. Arct2-2 TaxID=2568653 RepID=UPI0010A58611|nr:hypothetical protein [Deinococcus sp. Arct2-2]THF71962.1 hypothetical protein E7T06_00955 [Deinococcus sp. Arct2-2]